MIRQNLPNDDSGGFVLLSGRIKLTNQDLKPTHL